MSPKLAEKSAKSAVVSVVDTFLSPPLPGSWSVVVVVVVGATVVAKRSLMVGINGGGMPGGVPTETLTLLTSRSNNDDAVGLLRDDSKSLQWWLYSDGYKYIHIVNTLYHVCGVFV